MKIKIDKNGNLWLERKGKMKIQECKNVILTRNSREEDYPTQSIFTEYTYRPCGDWCIHFKEPKIHRGYYSNSEKEPLPNDGVTIETCAGDLHSKFEDFTDER